MSSESMIEAWLRFKAHNQGRADGTVVKYRGYLTRLAAFLEVRGVELIYADQSLIEEFTGLHAYKEGLTARSRRAIVAAVKGFYKWAQRERLRVDDPASGVPYPSSGRKLPVTLETKYAEALLKQPDFESFHGLRDIAILLLLMGCGMRVSGLVGLNESSLRIDEIDGEKWLIVKVVEKGGHEREIPAPQDVLYMLKAYLAHEYLAGIDRTLSNGDRVLFVSTMNRSIPPQDYYGEHRRISARSIHDMIKKYGEQAGIPVRQAHAHAMRHLYGTELAENGIDLLLRQVLMGHKDSRSTEQYTHLAMRSKVKAVAKGNPFITVRTPLTDILPEIKKRRL